MYIVAPAAQSEKIGGRRQTWLSGVGRASEAERSNGDIRTFRDRRMLQPPST
jgi:hypothetical protein